MSSGGKRQGAGRKPADPKMKKVQLSVSVSQQTKDKVRLIKAKGGDINRMIDEFVNNIPQ